MADQTIFWIRLDVRLAEVMLTDDLPALKVDGFVMEVGCTARDERDMRSLIESWVQRDVPPIGNVTFDHIGVLEVEELQHEVYDDDDVADSLLQHPQRRGVWYSSGRGFYSDDAADDEFSSVELTGGRPECEK